MERATEVMRVEAITVGSSMQARVIAADRITQVVHAALHLNKVIAAVITVVQRLRVVTAVEIAAVAIVVDIAEEVVIAVDL
jgi:hypothetical protein